MSNIKLRFIKPSRETDSSPILTPQRVIDNKRRNTETSLFLDLNILIRMEEVFLKNVNPVDVGLMELVNFINQCPPQSLCLSPGFALSEVHPKYKKRCFELFEVFLSAFCPQMTDHPTATRNSEVDLDETRKVRFEELDISEQYFHSVSFYSLLQIHIIDKTMQDLQSHEKFSAYLDNVSKNINMLSAVEAEIAKYCFCKKSEDYSQEFKDKIQAIKDNFLDRNEKPVQRKRNIFNSVQDLKYGKAALELSEVVFFGKNQETWIATLDSKLYWLSESIHHHPVPGEPDGKYYWAVRNDEQKKCPYWNAVDWMLKKKQGQRINDGSATKPLGEDGLEKIHKILITKGFDDFSSTFGTI